MAASSTASSGNGDRPLRIGLVSDYLPPGRIGGVGEAVAGLRDAYRRLGAETVVITTGRRNGPEPGVVRVGRSAISLGGASFLRPGLFRGLDLLHVIGRAHV